MSVRNLILVVVLVAAAAISIWWTLRQREPESVARISGNIELTEVLIGFKTPGRLAQLMVEEGDTVEAGQLIARLDTAELESQQRLAEAMLRAAESRIAQLHTAIAFQREYLAGSTAQRAAELRAAEAHLDEVREGSRVQEKRQAQAMMRRAQTEFDRAEADWKRADTLFRNEDISAAEHDRARAVHLVAQHSLEQAKEHLNLIEEGPRPQTIAAAEAQTDRAHAALRTTEAGSIDLERLERELSARMAEADQARANLSLIETRIADASAISPIHGVVLVKSAEEGEVLAAGVSIATIGNLAQPWLRGYVNQHQQGRVRLGSEVKVFVDSYPDRPFTGRLSFLASEAEFTPKQIQTTEERSRLVYRVKIDLQNPDGVLKLNMPAEAEIPLQESQTAARR